MVVVEDPQDEAGHQHQAEHGECRSLGAQAADHGADGTLDPPGTMKLIIQIPCLNEEESLPVTLHDLPRKVDGLRRRRVARHRRRVDRPDDRGRARARRRPHRPADQQQGPRERLPGGPRRRPQARRRRDRQHRRRQPVRRPRHRDARRADRRRRRRHGRRRPPGDDDRALLAGEEDAPAARLLGRAPGVADRRPRHHLGLPRLQPRGRAQPPGRLEVHLHARDDHPGGEDDGRDRPRAGPDQPEAARVAPVPVDVDLHPPQRGLDLPHLRALRAAARVHDRRG